MQGTIQRIRGLWWPRIWQLAAAMLLGLFVGRVFSELARPAVLGIIAITALPLLTALGLSRHIPSRYTWVTLPLALYVFHPELNPTLAWSTVLVTIVAFLAQLATEEQSPLARLLELLQKQVLLLTLIVMGLYLLLYISTTAPGLLPADSGELQLVATELGVAHPPGFALYTLLAHLATRLPLGGAPAYQVNLLSAFTGAATIGVLFLSAWLLTRRLSAALLAALALGSATTFWSQSTTANVRSLTALFAALALLCLLLLWRRKEAASTRPDAASGGAQAGSALYVALSLLLGLGITHHASLLFMALVFLAFLLWLDPSFLRQPRRWPGPLLALLAGLLPLLYFPLRAHSGAHGATPELATLNGFLEHVLALGFRGDLFAFSELPVLWQRIKVMGGVMLFQFHPSLLAGMVLGFVLLLWRQPKVAFLLGGSFALHTFITATYRAPQTVEYMLPAYVPAALLLASGVGLWTSPRELPRQRRSVLYRLQYLFLGLLLVVTLGQTAQNYDSYAWLGADETARTYAATLLEQAPPDSLLLAGWHWATPLWYLQQVEGQRPDVEVEYVFPTGEAYGETWARRIREGYEAGRPVIATHYDPAHFGGLPPATPLGDAYLYHQEPISELPATFEPLNVILGEQIELLGYQVAEPDVAPTRKTTLLLAWRPVATLSAPLTLFAHLIAFDGGLHAQQDVPAQVQPQGITITRLTLVPRPGATPDGYGLLVGAYDSNSGEPLLAPDDQPRRRIGAIRTGTLLTPLATANHTYRPLAAEGLLPDSRLRLVGYDWDNTLPQQPRLYLHWRTNAGYLTDVEDVPAGATFRLPPYYGAWGMVITNARLQNDGGHYVPLGQGIIWRGEQRLSTLSPAPGQQLILPQQFAASRPVLNDYVASVRLIGYEEDGFSWNWWDLDDTIPAMGAIPTLKWIGGSHVRDPHFPTVSPEAPPGQQLGAILQLYDAFTQEVLPILDERIMEQFLGIPLGGATVR